MCKCADWLGMGKQEEEAKENILNVCLKRKTLLQVVVLNIFIQRPKFTVNQAGMTSELLSFSFKKFWDIQHLISPRQARRLSKLPEVLDRRGTYNCISSA